MSSLLSQDDRRASFSDTRQPGARWLLLLGMASAAVALCALSTRFIALDSVLAAVMRLAGRHEASPTQRATLARALIDIAMLAAVAGALLLALARSGAFRDRVDRWIRWDALRVNSLRTPSPYRVLLLSTIAALVVMGAWTQRGRLGPFVQWLFQKEGPFEVVTFALDLLGAILCVLAAAHWKVRRPLSIRIARPLFAALGVLLFFVAMEEINWGQTLLGFATPEAWSRINYQHEASIHNLLDKEALTRTWKAVAIAFGAGVIAIIAVSARFKHSLFAVLAPPAALLPLALCASYAGARLHPELIELLLSAFFALYGYRVWRAARSTSHDFPAR